MLRKFEVCGYKNFGERFVLDLTDIRDYKFNTQYIKNNLIKDGIIYGKNAIGKTNLGTALLDIRNNFKSYLHNDYKKNERFLNADGTVDAATFIYEFQFDDDIVRYQYKKTDKNKLVSEILKINDEIIFNFNQREKKMLEENISLINANTLNWEFVEDSKSILSYIINNTTLENTHVLWKLYEYVKGMTMIQGNLAGQDTFNMALLLEILIERNRVKELEQFLNYFGVEEKLVVLADAAGQKSLYFDHLRPVPFYQNCSSGTGSLLQLFSWIMGIQKISFLYLDDFDAFYHYEIAEKLVKLFGERKECQILMTSHNIDLLSNKIMRPDCLYILTKKRIVTLANATKRELREGHNLEKLYKSGEFRVE